VSLQITGGFALLWPLTHANFAFADWPPVECKLNTGGRFTHENFSDSYAHGGYLGSICMKLAAKQQIAVERKICMC